MKVIPLVTTPVDAQGLEQLSEVIPVSDNANTLAKELVQLLKDDTSWIGQARRQLDYAKAHFSRQASIAAIIMATSAAAANAEKRKLAMPCKNAVNLALRQLLSRSIRKAM